MADHLPPVPEHDPLGDRLRATFTAERDDIDRKYAAVQPQRTWWRASTAWIPMAIAAAVLTVAGFAFFGARSGDDAVELDFAAQEDGSGRPEQPDGLGGPTPAGTPARPLEGFIPPEVFPYQSGVNWCNDEWWSPDRIVVWRADAKLAPIASEPEASGTLFVTAEVPLGTRVALPGGCTAAGTTLGPMVWYEVERFPGAPTEWINSQYLITEAAYEQWLADGTTPPELPLPPDSGVPVAAPAPQPEFSSQDLPSAVGENCAEPMSVFPVRFVWGIAADDPDGGLVAHSEPGIDAPVTRILTLDEVVNATGNCARSSTGSMWYELAVPDGSVDWVSGRYLKDNPGPACLSGEQYGSRTRDGERSEQFLGPLQGLALVDGDRTAFFAGNGAQNYRWFDSAAIIVGRPCYGERPTGQACAFGNIQLTDPLSPETIWAGFGPQELQVTGRTLPGRSSAVQAIEVRLLAANGATYTGFLDPFDTRIEYNACSAVTDGSPDSFAEVPCNATDSDIVVGTTERGGATSDANYVRNIRAEQGSHSQGPCTRIVIEFGADAGTTAELLPLMQIEKQADSTRLVLPAEFFNGPNEPLRLSTEAGEVLITNGNGGQPAIEVLYRQTVPVNVWFLESPARVIIDALNAPPPVSNTFSGPFGDVTILRQPIQSDLTGRGILEGQPIVVGGFGRPFESQGLYRIYVKDSDVSLNEFWQTDPEPLVEEVLFTNGWLNWGEFQVQLPALLPGTYIGVFGEVPPTDNPQFSGVGQVFRVYSPSTPPADGYPVAELLPSVVIDE